ncbi:glycosyltransferase family 39 protein [Dyella sp. M7H15-1]|uniref:ArnT family glycosyltransferase n=1 Tax=Dyella sp. M7H15-1 TaxID=2501295 RepID=UPI0013E8C59E|nr:glycosyltransferase family 39 protein [Dyella sp. M7H15-1]
MFQPANAHGAKGNAVQYYNYARNLVQHGIYSVEAPGNSLPVSDSFRDPGYPVFMAAWMKIFPQWDSWYVAIIFSQVILSTATVMLWLGVGRYWMPWRWLTVAGVLMAVWPHSISMSSHLLSETLYGFLVALAMFVYSLGVDKPNIRWALICGACFAAAALTNSVLLPFSVLLMLYMLIRRKFPPWIGVALMASTLCLTAPWLIRNSRLPPSPASSANRALMNLVEGSWPLYHKADMASTLSHDPQAVDIMNQINSEIAVIEADRKAGVSMMLERMSRDPGYYILWYLQKPAMLWDWSIRIGVGDIYVYVTYHSPFDDNPLWRAVEAACHGGNGVLALLALTGGLLALRKSNHSSMAGVALLLLTVTAIHTALQAEPRYSIPYRCAEILLGVFAAYWLIAQWPKLRTRSRKQPPNSSQSRLPLLMKC